MKNSHKNEKNTSKSQISESLKQLHILLEIWSFIDQVNNVQSCPSFLQNSLHQSTNPFLVDKGCTYTNLEVSNNLLDNCEILISYKLQKWISQHLYNDLRNNTLTSVSLTVLSLNLLKNKYMLLLHVFISRKFAF